MNHRQRVFDILQRQAGSPLTPEQIVTMSGGDPERWAIGIESVRAALKWLVINGKVEKHRRRRDFGYSLVDGAIRPIDQRTKEARDAKA